MLSTQPLSFHILSKLSPLTHINTNQQVPAFILRSFLQQPAAASNTIPSILPFSFVQKSFFNQLKTFTHIWNKWSRCCCVCVVCPGLICSVSCCVFVRVWPIWCSRCRPHVRSQLYNEPIAVLLLWNTLHTLFLLSHRLQWMVRVYFTGRIFISSSYIFISYKYKYSSLRSTFIFILSLSSLLLFSRPRH